MAQKLTFLPLGRRHVGQSSCAGLVDRKREGAGEGDRRLITWKADLRLNGGAVRCWQLEGDNDI